MFGYLFRLVFGALAVLFGSSIILWVLYNYLVKRQPEFSGPRFFSGFGVALPTQPVTTGADGTKVELGDLATKPSHIIQGRVVLSDGKPISSRTRIYLNLDDAYDSQDLLLGPDGEFEFGAIPSGRIELTVRVSNYRISGKNPNKDWLNEGQIVGLLEGDLQDFVIHLEPGARLNRDNAPAGVEEQPRDKPLRGASL